MQCKRMKKGISVFRRAGLLLAAVFLGGCVLSLNPFCDPKDKVPAPVPDGKWRLLKDDGAPSKEGLWEFKGQRLNVYDDRGHWRAFDVTWFRIGGTLFADTVPARTETSMSTSEQYWFFHMVPFHMVSRVEVDGQRLLVRPLLSKAFNESGSQPVPGGIVRRELDTLVLDANADDWRRFLSRHAHDDAVFKPTSELVFVPVPG